MSIQDPALPVATTEPVPSSGNVGLRPAGTGLAPAESYPVNLDAPYPESSRRSLLFFGWLHALPASFTGFFETFPYVASAFVSWWSVLLTGKYPQKAYDRQRRVLRHYAQLSGYLLHITDETPRFNSPEEATYPIHVTFPEQLPTVSSRWRPLYVGLLAIPAAFGYVCRFYVSLAAALVAIAAILFTGRHPEGLHRFNVATGQQYVRLTAFVLMMTEVKPPTWG